MPNIAKENAARAALKLVRKGMTLGIGTGSTANIFIDLLAERERTQHLGLKCIATSEASAARASAAGLRVVGFGAAPRIDLAVDGADVVSKDLCLLKGLGGALTREKCVAYRAQKFVVLVGEDKLRQELSGIVAIEVLPFAVPAVLRELSAVSKGACVRCDSSGRHFTTDNGNHIIDARMAVRQPEKTERALNCIPGVVENGIFTRADIVLVGGEKGCRVLRNKKKFVYRPLSLRE
ncbi:Ribose-5-phosphate isomerase A [Candidatus Burarchaeum australiense]|nr:Ribose-5-phosphate isomerase A [Candidatus Burarchaeum australiense]